ncbi:putative formin-like protein 3 isoform X1 [Iris pallida]|uniref:Formin-like protein 3 isoform X1 n=1 Tax=Iris pallida TaxID=29817 RepID=A0AAX6GUY9_IRIPA|nr:putative formin-like protein 3 isoform X1 [Iris pallida]
MADPYSGMASPPATLARLAEPPPQLLPPFSSSSNSTSPSPPPPLRAARTTVAATNPWPRYPGLAGPGQASAPSRLVAGQAARADSAQQRHDSARTAGRLPRACDVVAADVTAVGTPLAPTNSGLPSPGGQRPPGRAVEAIRAFRTTFRRDELGNDDEIAPRRSDFAHVFPKIRPLDRQFLHSIAISFRGANFVSLYLLHRSSVWRATSFDAKLDSVASVGPPILISCSGYRGERRRGRMHYLPWSEGLGRHRSGDFGTGGLVSFEEIVVAIQ